MTKEKQKKKQRKRAQMVPAILIGIIILVVCAAVVFLFLKGIPYKETVDKESCHQSVILRSQSIATLKPGQTLGIPLNCKTQEIKIDALPDTLIKKEIANAMYDCWWTLGRGKLDFFSASTWRGLGVPGAGTAKAACVICSTIHFNKPSTRQIDISKYLFETKIPNQNITYADYFTGQKTILPAELDAKPIRMDQDYAIVYMGIKGGSVTEALVATGVTAATTSAFVFGFGGINKVTGIIVGIATVIEAIGQAITQATSSHAAAVHCESGLGGCMVLMLVPLNAETLRSECQLIESIP